MLEDYMCKSIITLWKSGKSKKEISRSLNKDIKTIRKVIKKYASWTHQLLVKFYQLKQTIESIHEFAVLIYFIFLDSYF